MEQDKLGYYTAEDWHIKYVPITRDELILIANYAYNRGVTARTWTKVKQLLNDKLFKQYPTGVIPGNEIDIALKKAGLSNKYIYGCSAIYRWNFDEDEAPV